MRVSLTIVRASDGSERLRLVSPYNANLVDRCHELQGFFVGDSRAWLFEISEMDNVRQACIEFLGVDPVVDMRAEAHMLAARLGALLRTLDLDDRNAIVTTLIDAVRVEPETIDLDEDATTQ